MYRMNAKLLGYVLPGVSLAAALAFGQTNELSPIGDMTVDASQSDPVNGVGAGADLIMTAGDINGQTQAQSDPNFAGKPIKLDFRGAPLTEVIRALSHESGHNFVFPPDVGSAKVNITLAGVPWDQALRALLETHALGMVEVGPNLIRIDRLDTLSKEKDSRERVRQSAARLTPTQTIIFPVSYAKAKTLQPLIAALLADSMSIDKRVRVEADERTNSLVVEAIPVDLAKIKTMVERLDLQTPQVQIAGRIIEVIKSNSTFVGVNWASPFNADAGRGTGFGNIIFPNSLSSEYSIDPGVRADKSSSGNFSFKIGSINDAFSVDLILKMEELKSNIEVLQSNRIIVQDNEKANLSAGQTDFFRAAAGTVVQGAGGTAAASSMDEVSYNLTLAVEPHITADGNVQMKLDISSDSPIKTLQANAQAGKTTRALHTTMLRRSGETAVIGGLYTTDRQQSVRGVPVLSSLPIIGALFRSKTASDNQRELMIMVTPTILNPAQGGGTSAVGAALTPEVGPNMATNMFGGESPVTNPAVNSGSGNGFNGGGNSTPTGNSNANPLSTSGNGANNGEEF